MTLPVTNGLVLWLNADAINTADSTEAMSAGSGTYHVKGWPNEVQNSAYQASQPVASKEPLLYPDHVNGHALIQFNGNTSINTNLPQISGDKSIFIVQCRMDTQVRTEIASTAGSGMFLGNSGGAESVGRLNIGQDILVPGQLNDMVLKSLVRSGTAETLTVNGLSSTASVPDSAAGSYTIGSGFAGLITEVLFYNRAVTAQESQLIEDYLCEKYLLWNYTLQDRTGLQFWLAADAIQGANGVYPTQLLRYSGTNVYLADWPDRGNAGLSANMPVTTYQPLYLQNALNGWPVIAFNGASSFLLTNMTQMSGDKSIFIVHRELGNGGQELGSTSGAASGMFLAASSTLETKGRLAISAADLSLPTLPGQFLVKSFIRSGSNETLTVDDSSTSAVVADDASGQYTLSSNIWPFQGDIAEVIMYNRAMTPEESGTIEDYLSAKWSYPQYNIFSVSPDIQGPATTNGSPGPGLRVRQTVPAYAGTAVYHTLYLPTDWHPGGTYPVIVEYAPNGPFSDQYGDTTTGHVEDCTLGYGLSGGHGYIWISMPTVGGSPLANQTYWWGTMSSTEDYCLKAVNYVCQNYGGDPSAVILAGFSRGGIACNYVGLFDSNIADTWLAFFSHSGYDGQYTDWGYPYDDSASALTRLQRLQGRAQHISTDLNEATPQSYIASTGINMSALSFRTLPYWNHTGLWVEDPIELRRDARAWLAQVVAQKPGTYSISGTVTSLSGGPVAGALVQSGSTHFTYSGATGGYVLAGLINSTRTVTATAAGYAFAPRAATVSGGNVTGINFQSSQ